MCQSRATLESTLLELQGLVMRAQEFLKPLTNHNLFEINMSPTSLRQLASKITANAGMEFEMIVPGTDNEDSDMEPDYDHDSRTRSFENIEEFFNDGDFNSRNQVRRLIEQLQERYYEWESEKIDSDWAKDGKDYLRDWINNNEWIQEDKIREHLESQGLDEEAIDAAFAAYNRAPRYTKASDLQAAQEADENYNNYIEADRAADDELEDLISTEWNDGGSMHDSALDKYREENGGSRDESDFLEDARFRYMSDIASEFDIQWPYYTTSGSVAVDAESVADDFADAMGRTVKASSSYHAGSIQRPDASNSHYVVEPDGSLEGDNPGDGGLEFVSPALPIGELLSDLDKVAKWASMYGCYTNESTGLHINVSVEGWSGDYSKLDYVKLALLMGDNYILEQFGRAGSTYCKSAMNEIRSRVAQRPEDAGVLLEKMKTGLDGLASKAIHSGQTAKFTSINTKSGYIEFRSPGGDWLGAYAADPGKIVNTLLRFVVALDAAVDPEKYKQEYLKKLYTILQPKSYNDTMAYFVKYAAGELPKAALKSFIRQAQLERESKNSGELSDKQSDLGDQTRPFQTYMINNGSYNTTTIQSVSADDAVRQFRNRMRNESDPSIYNLISRDNQILATGGDVVQGQQTFTGEWQILDPQDREIHRFGGVGNVQADANSAAVLWLRQNPRQLQPGVTVVPIMR